MHAKVPRRTICGFVARPITARVLERLRSELGVRSLAAAFDFEIFLIYLRILMDDIAKCTPVFFTTRRSLRDRSFEDLKSSFRRHPTVDACYAEFLAADTSWFDDLKSLRDDVVHQGLSMAPWGRVQETLRLR